MFSPFKKILIITFLLTTFWPRLVAADPAATNVVATSAFGHFFSGAQQTASNMGYTADSTSGKSLLLSRISKIISFILGLVGVIFLALVIYGGFLWMTAAGNDKQVETAKNIISRAAIGLVVVILAYAITFFVINQL